MERKFLGIWLPAEIWLHPDLTVVQKMILAELDSFDGGNGVNEERMIVHFRTFFSIDALNMKLAVNDLIRLGFLDRGQKEDEFILKVLIYG